MARFYEEILSNFAYDTEYILIITCVYVTITFAININMLSLNFIDFYLPA